jgi:hypothetical protein
MAAATKADAPCDRPALLALPWWAPPRPPAPHYPPSHGRVTSGSDSELFQGLTRKSPCLSCTPSVCRMYATCPRGHPTSAPKGRPGARRGRGSQVGATTRTAEGAPVAAIGCGPPGSRSATVAPAERSPWERHRRGHNARDEREGANAAKVGAAIVGPPGLQRSRDLTHLCSREMVHPFGASGLPA